MQELDIIEIQKAREKLLNANSCFGICSNTEDNKHVVFVDFDYKSYSTVYHTLSDMQNSFNLSTFYIINSLHGYNAFSLTKMKIEDIEKMLKIYKEIDPLFIKLAIEKRGFFVLRMDKDKSFCSTIQNSDYATSSYAHYLFFKNVMRFPVSQYHKYDSYTKTRIISYKSVKHGFADIQYKTELDLNEI